MTDKEKILAKVEFWLNETNYEPFTDEVFGRVRTLKELKSYIDSLQEEPIKIKKGCKYRCLCDMINKDTGNISFIGGKIYLAPKDNTLVSEENGWLCDTSENASNFELIEEPVSEELEKAAIEYCGGNKGCDARVRTSFIMGAMWQQEQFEKNRLAACDKMTEEEAEIESDFCIGIIESENRQPTFDDAIKYGMRLQKEQMMSKAIVREVKVDAGGYPYIDTTELYDYDKDMPLAKEGDKVKILVIK